MLYLIIIKINYFLEDIKMTKNQILDKLQQIRTDLDKMIGQIDDIPDIENSIIVHLEEAYMSVIKAKTSIRGSNAIK